MNKIKYIIADDHPTFRAGLKKILNDANEFECIGETGDGLEVFPLVDKLKPDIILVDIQMPGLNGIEVVKKILSTYNDISVIVLSAYDYDIYVLSSLRAGVRGYILKTTPPEDLVKAIHLIHSGKTVLGVSSWDRIKNSIDDETSQVGTKSKNLILGDRELAVLNLVGKGLSNKEIATELDISERTVQAHLVSIFKKTGTNSRTQAVVYALKGGMISIYI